MHHRLMFWGVTVRRGNMRKYGTWEKPCKENSLPFLAVACTRFLVCSFTQETAESKMSVSGLVMSCPWGSGVGSALRGPRPPWERAQE